MATAFLVGVDGSETAQRAADYAAERAAAEGAELILAHVVPWSGFEIKTASELASRHADKEREIEIALTDMLRPLADELEGRGITVSCVVRHGQPSEALCDLAEERRVSQVFAGRRGRSKFKTLVFGSVASALVQVSPVPVTVVP